MVYIGDTTSAAPSRSTTQSTTASASRPCPSSRSKLCTHKHNEKQHSCIFIASWRWPGMAGGDSTPPSLQELSSRGQETMQSPQPSPEPSSALATVGGGRAGRAGYRCGTCRAADIAPGGLGETCRGGTSGARTARRWAHACFFFCFFLRHICENKRVRGKEHDLKTKSTHLRVQTEQITAREKHHPFREILPTEQIYTHNTQHAVLLFELRQKQTKHRHKHTGGGYERITCPNT